MNRRPYKFTARKRAAFLKLLTEGQRRGAAAEAVGVTRQTAQQTYALESDFASQVDEAELAANEPVEDALYQAAVSGNVRAEEVWLYNRLPDRWKDQRNVSGSLNLRVIDVRKEAERLAKDLGLSVEQVLQEAGLLTVATQASVCSWP
ncbi:MAG: hypothetical protein ACRDGF_06165 [Chloroflexota bacterium]